MAVVSVHETADWFTDAIDVGWGGAPMKAIMNVVVAAIKQGS